MRGTVQTLRRSRLQAMAQSQYKDLVLGDSVKIETSIDELVAGFSVDKPLVYQVRCCLVIGCGFRTFLVLVDTCYCGTRAFQCDAPQVSVFWTCLSKICTFLPWQSPRVYSCSQVGFDVQPEVTWKSSYRELKVRRQRWLSGRKLHMAETRGGRVWWTHRSVRSRWPSHLCRLGEADDGRSVTVLRCSAGLILCITPSDGTVTSPL